MSSNASCMSSTSSCIPLSAIVKSFKSLKSNFTLNQKLCPTQRTSKIKIENLKQSQSLFWSENIWNVEENIDPGFRILFLRPLQFDHLINFKKVLHDDYIKIISYLVKYNPRCITGLHRCWWQVTSPTSRALLQQQKSITNILFCHQHHSHWLQSMNYRYINYNYF